VQSTLQVVSKKIKENQMSFDMILAEIKSSLALTPAYNDISLAAPLSGTNTATASNRQAKSHR
jgi:hypothetical protein